MKDVKKQQVTIVIPAHNEAQSIGSLVKEVKRHADTVIVVADGCSDQTASLAEEAGAYVIEAVGRVGKGRALCIGWERALKLYDSDWILFMDGDLQHRASDIPKFLEYTNDDSVGTELVLGSRKPFGFKMPLERKWANIWMTWLIGKAIGRNIQDSQCGFRMVRADFLKSRVWLSHHFEIETEMLFHASFRGWKVKEVSVSCAYGEEISKIVVFLDTLRWLRTFAHCAWQQS